MVYFHYRTQKSEKHSQNCAFLTPERIMDCWHRHRTKSVFLLNYFLSRETRKHPGSFPPPPLQLENNMEQRMGVSHISPPRARPPARFPLPQGEGGASKGRLQNGQSAKKSEGLNCPGLLQTATTYRNRNSPPGNSDLAGLFYSVVGSSEIHDNTYSRNTALLVLPCAAQYALNFSACSFFTLHARLEIFSFWYLAVAFF